MENINTMTDSDWQVVAEMAEPKYFPLFYEDEEMFAELSDEQAGAVLKALFRLKSGDEIPPEDLTARVAYKAVKRQICAFRGKYEETCRKRAEAGAKGAASRWEEKGMANAIFAIDGDSKNGYTNTNTIQIQNKDIERVMEIWNSLSDVGITPVRSISAGSKRRQQLTARLKQYTVEDFEKAVSNIRQSKFLQGQSKSGWTIDFDWFIRPSNFQKVLEGNYSDRSAKVTPINGVTAMSKRDYQWDDLERQLLEAQHRGG